MKVACCAPMETQRATEGVARATVRATEAQPGSLKALADAVLARNRARNHSAIDGEKPRNLMAAEAGRELHPPGRNCTAPEPLPDPAAEARRQRVLAMLDERPGIHYAVDVDIPDTDPVILALAIRGAMQDGSIVTCELRVPRAKYDPFLLLDLIERHGGTLH